MPRQAPAPTPGCGKIQGPSGSSLAELLAQQFPSARIIVGAPEELEKQAEPETPAPEPEPPNALEVQMRRLKELLEKDRGKSQRL